jgi:hypothetical protein
LSDDPIADLPSCFILLFSSASVCLYQKRKSTKKKGEKENVKRKGKKEDIENTSPRTAKARGAISLSSFFLEMKWKGERTMTEQKRAEEKKEGDPVLYSLAFLGVSENEG